jgi:hypothetical protein
MHQVLNRYLVPFCISLILETLFYTPVRIQKHLYGSTWVPGAVLGFTNINGENSNLSLVSWKDWTDPSPGMYSLEIYPPRTREFIIREIPKNVLIFGTFPAWIDIQDFHDGLITFNYTNRTTGVRDSLFSIVEHRYFTVNP